MTHLQVNTKLLAFILLFLTLLPSCNNEEIFIVEESAIIAEEAEPTEEETPNTEDEVPVVPVDAVDDTVFTMENVPVDIEAYLNDINLPESITLSNTNPSNGVLSINNNDTPDNLLDDTVVYTPNAGYYGIDSFDYTLCDATNSDNCDTATVTITVEPREDDIATELKAFPSAYGAGAYTTGGRGGTVLHVTNLDWNNTVGSLKWALEENYTRTIVFDVSGIITIPPSDSTIYSNAKGNVTIAGQTAPEGGITIYGNPLRFHTQDNIIMRYVKFRKPGSSSYWDWCFIAQHGSDIIVDNCSFAYSEEMALSSGTSYDDGNVTFQNNLFSECKDAILIGNSDNTNVQMGEFSVLNNVFSNVGWRSPAKIGGALQADIINNAVHNWWAKPIRADSDDFEINLIGNYFQTGNSTRNNDDDWQGHTMWRVNVDDTMTPKIWDEDNTWTIYDEGGSNEYDPKPVGYPADISLAWKHFSLSTVKPVKSEWFQTSRLPLKGATPIILPSSQVLNSLLPEVGANKYLKADGTFGEYRDPIDTTAIYNFENEVSYSYSANWDTAAAGLPSMPTNTRPAGYDSDGDGMADIWENAMFGPDLTLKDGTADTDGDGYTDLEEFLNQVDK